MLPYYQIAARNASAQNQNSIIVAIQLLAIKIQKENPNLEVENRNLNGILNSIRKGDKATVENCLNWCLQHDKMLSYEGTPDNQLPPNEMYDELVAEWLVTQKGHKADIVLARPNLEIHKK